MSQPIYRVKIDGEVFEIDKLTLGEARLLRAHFNVFEIHKMLPGDPNVIAGLVYLCYRRKHPDWEHERLMNTVDDVAMEDIEEANEVEPDPKPRAKRAGK